MKHHDNIPVWDVQISVFGPVSIEQIFELNVRKDLEHPEAFYSNVRVQHSENGFDAIVTAFAPNSELAESAAVLWFGRMLDFLTLKLDLPLQLDLTENFLVQKNFHRVKRKIDIDDFRFAFRESRIFSIEETVYSRSLSWYRKGKYTQDPFDKFLAFWNSIEAVASYYNPNKQACEGKGTICQIWESFKHVWGECTDWEFIGGQTQWIDEGNKIRKNIAHGIIPIEIDSIQTIMNKIPEVEKVAHKFLHDWFSVVRPKMTPKLINKLR